MSELEETLQEKVQHPLFTERGTHVSPYIKLRLERNIDCFSEQVLKKFKGRLERATAPVLHKQDPDWFFMTHRHVGASPRVSLK